MSTIDIICELLRENNIKQKELTDYLGISKNNMTEWKAGRRSSLNKHLPKIAEYLDVSVDYLLGKTDIKSASPQFSDEALEVIKLLDVISDEDKKMMLRLLRSLPKDESK